MLNRTDSSLQCALTTIKRARSPLLLAMHARLTITERACMKNKSPTRKHAMMLFLITRASCSISGDDVFVFLNHITVNILIIHYHTFNINAVMHVILICYGTFMEKLHVVLLYRINATSQLLVSTSAISRECECNYSQVE